MTGLYQCAMDISQYRRHICLLKRKYVLIKCGGAGVEQLTWTHMMLSSYEP
jgi:hypothetical protein